MKTLSRGIAFLLALLLSSQFACSVTRRALNYEYRPGDTLQLYNGEMLHNRIFISEPRVTMRPNFKDKDAVLYFPDDAKISIHKYLRERFEQARVIGEVVESKNKSNLTVSTDIALQYKSDLTTGSKAFLYTMLTLEISAVIAGIVAGVVVDDSIGVGVGLGGPLFMGLLTAVVTIPGERSEHIASGILRAKITDSRSGRVLHEAEYTKKMETITTGSTSNKRSKQSINHLLDKLTEALTEDCYERLRILQTSQAPTKKARKAKKAVAVLCSSKAIDTDPLLLYVDDVIRSKLAQRKDVMLVNTRDQSEAMEMVKESYKGCYDAKCQIGLSKRLSVTHIIAWQLTRSRRGNCRLELKSYRFEQGERIQLGHTTADGGCRSQSVVDTAVRAMRDMGRGL